MDKLLNENDSKNTLVHVVLSAGNEKYECIGVLTREDKESIRVAFNAKNDKVVDYLDIKRSDIKSINVLDQSKIENL